MTAAGRVNDDEDTQDSFWREIEEELGLAFVNELTFARLDPGVRIAGDETGEKLAYARFVSLSDLDLIRWHPSTGGLVFVDAEGVGKIQNLRDFDKASGVPDLNVIAMFPDEIEVVRQALAIDWNYQ